MGAGSAEISSHVHMHAMPPRNWFPKQSRAEQSKISKELQPKSPEKKGSKTEDRRLRQRRLAADATCIWLQGREQSRLWEIICRYYIVYIIYYSI